MGLRPAGCHLDWCDDVNVGKWTPLALGATGGSLHGIERVCLRPQQHVYLPLRLLNSRKGEELLQAPWGCSLKGRQASSSNFSLSTPPSCDLPNFLHLIVFLSPNSVATNYSFSFLLVLITFFFHILVDHRNHKDVRVENQRSNFWQTYYGASGGILICKVTQFKDNPKANISTKLWMPSLQHDGVHYRRSQLQTWAT